MPIHEFIDLTLLAGCRTSTMSRDGLSRIGARLESTRLRPSHSSSHTHDFAEVSHGPTGGAIYRSFGCATTHATPVYAANVAAVAEQLAH